MSQIRQNHEIKGEAELYYEAQRTKRDIKEEESVHKKKAITQKWKYGNMDGWSVKKCYIYVGSCVDMSLVNDDLAFTFLSGQELPPLTLGLNISQHLNWRTSIPHICHFLHGQYLIYF